MPDETSGKSESRGEEMDSTAIVVQIFRLADKFDCDQKWKN